MKKSNFICIIVCAIFVALLGTLGHFFYEWSGNNPYVGMFFPVNESIWEHMKLFFFPALICYLVLCFLKKDINPELVYTFPKAILLGTFLIPVLFYSYSGILGYNISFLDISTFYISDLISFIYLYKFAMSEKNTDYSYTFNISLLVCAFMFIYFTNNPPTLGIFSIPL